LPPPAEPVQVLAPLTRVRAERVAAGELAAERLYDVRAFKCCYAELGYLRRLAAAGRAGGTVVASMRQLVAGLAALHPAWKITGEGFEDRDRHHRAARAVRRRLEQLQAMGLLRWRIGADLEGEARRTEIELRPAPELSVEELQAAARKLERWQARYGRALNTGSRRGPGSATLLATDGRAAPQSASAAAASAPAARRRAGRALEIINQIRHPLRGSFGEHRRQRERFRATRGLSENRRAHAQCADPRSHHESRNA
jgi:hypothetical protein